MSGPTGRNPNRVNTNQTIDSIDSNKPFVESAEKKPIPPKPGPKP